MSIFTLPLVLFVLCSVTWIYYVAIIRLYREKDNLNNVAYFMTAFGALIGVPLDILLNLISSVILLDVPKEVTLSQKLSRLNDTGGWRGDVARWICAELLDPFDPRGFHCK